MISTNIFFFFFFSGGLHHKDILFFFSKVFCVFVLKEVKLIPSRKFSSLLNFSLRMKWSKLETCH